LALFRRLRGRPTERQKNSYKEKSTTSQNLSRTLSISV
jgi:hypothetical protein